MIIYRPGSEIDGASRPGFEVATVSIAREAFEAACRAASRPDLIDIANRYDLVTPHPTVLARFLTAMRLTARLAAEASLRKDVEPAVVDSLSVLPSLALETLASSRPAPAQRTHPGRTRALCRAFDYICEHREEPITVQSLCEAAEVSERTLQYMFRERFDVTPKQFVMSHRLNSVRRELRRFGSSVKISDIANRWGFWHMGQFAKDYKRQFGELPSGTLNRVAPPDSSA
jgi:AraC family ethanolamine operon transcriptional activator